MSDKPVVYAFNNGPRGPFGDQQWIAVAEDGETIAQHVSSSRGWGQHDVGPTGFHRDNYAAKFGPNFAERIDYRVLPDGETPPESVSGGVGMTAPDRTTWTVDSDPTTGEPVLWHGDRAVLRHSDLRRVTWPEYGDRLFDLLTRVLAPDEATWKRLAAAVDDQLEGDTYVDRHGGTGIAFPDYFGERAAGAMLAAVCSPSSLPRHIEGGDEHA